MSIVIKNGWVITCDAHNTEINPGTLVIKNGIIETVVKASADDRRDAADTVIDAAGKILLPGLINGHTHSYANLVATFTNNMPLEIWMLYIQMLGKLMDPEDVYYNTLLGVIGMIKSGTTSCIDHLAKDNAGLDAAMSAYELSGFRGIIAPMISDKSYYGSLPLEEIASRKNISGSKNSDCDALIKMTRKLYKQWHGKHDRLGVMFGPSGPQRSSDRLLKTCSKLAMEYGTGFHTHALETKIQAETGKKFYGKPMLMHLDSLGCLHPSTSLVHGVWLSKEEARLVAERGCVVVHNPASNLTLGSGIAPVNMYRKLGIRVALGTDGSNAGGNLNMFESMKLAAILHNPGEADSTEWINPYDVLRMATLNSAHAACIEKKTGSIEVGKQADVIILNPKLSPILNPLRKPVAQIVYGENGCGVETVIIQGTIVLDQGRITTFSENEVFSQAERRVQKISDAYLRNKHELDKQAQQLKEALYPRKPG